MEQVLLLGAGLVARPLVNYLLQEPGIYLTIASRTLSKAENLIENQPNGSAYQLNVEHDDTLKDFIMKADIVISLLPWIHHLKVAKMCLEYKKHLVTTSYVKPEMQAFDKEAKQKRLLFLNEIGVDPGIDHMAAMMTIDNVKNAGGEIVIKKGDKEDES